MKLNKLKSLQLQTSKILNSSRIYPSQTNIRAEDLFNEPTKSRLEVTRDTWVHFYDRNGTFYKNLTVLANNSPTLKRVITDKTSLTLGDGLNPIEGSVNSIINSQRVSAQDFRDYSLLEQSLKSVNLMEESVLDILQKILIDYYTLGNAYIEIVRTYKEQSPKICIYHIQPYQVAIRKTLDAIVTHIGISEDWSIANNFSYTNNYNYKLDGDIKQLPLYPNFVLDEETNSERSILHLKNYSTNLFYFGLPDWISARIWAELEYRIQKFNQSEFENQFVPSAIVQFFGASTQEEAQEVIDRFQETMTDSGNERKIFAQVLADKEFAASVQLLTDNKEGNYLQLQQLAREAIISSARWTQSLTGIATAGSLGTNQQLRAELEYLQNIVISPVQKIIENSFLNVLVKEISEWERLPQFQNVSLKIAKSTPVSFVTEIDIKQVLTQDEQRELLGYQPIQNAATNSAGDN